MSLRSVLVAIVTIVTLLGGAFRAPQLDVVRARVALERASTNGGEDGSQLERGTVVSRVRVIRAMRGSDAPPPRPSPVTIATAIALPAWQHTDQARLAVRPLHADTSIRSERALAERMVFLN